MGLKGIGCGVVQVSVIGTSITNSQSAVRVRSWTGQSNGSQREAMAIFSQIIRGDYDAVLRASVVANIQRPSGTSVDLRLRDDGLGADDAAHDGVYSAAFVAFDAQGRYKVTVDVAATNLTSVWDIARRIFRYFSF